VSVRDWTNEVFLTIAEVAETLKVSEQAVRNWVDAGSLSAVRVGGRRIRILQSDLDQFIRPSARRQAPTYDPNELEPATEADRFWAGTWLAAAEMPKP
jgi:excisionase family DNA binding protein